MTTTKTPQKTAQSSAIPTPARAQKNAPAPVEAEARKAGDHLGLETRRAAQAIFLNSYARHANISSGADAAGVDRSTIYYWRDHDPEFAHAMELAQARARDVIRGELFRRAIVGWDEPAISAGQLVYEMIPVLDPQTGAPLLDRHDKPIYQRGKMVTIRRHSDSVLLAMARANLREYREKTEAAATDRYASMNDAILAAIQSPQALAASYAALSVLAAAGANVYTQAVERGNGNGNAAAQTALPAPSGTAIVDSDTDEADTNDTEDTPKRRQTAGQGEERPVRRTHDATPRRVVASAPSAPTTRQRHPTPTTGAAIEPAHPRHAVRASARSDAGAIARPDARRTRLSR